MEILGIGPSELLFIVIIALIVLGPRDMQKAGRTVGKWLRKVVTSDGWRLFQQTSREIQTLPNRLMREAALDELREVQNDIRKPLEAPRGAVDSPIVGSPDADPQASGKPIAGGAPVDSNLPPTDRGVNPTPPPDKKDENA